MLHIISKSKKKNFFWTFLGVILCLSQKVYSPDNQKKTPSVENLNTVEIASKNSTSTTKESSIDNQIPSEELKDKKPKGELLIDVKAKKFHITPMAFGGPHEDINALVAADLAKAGLISLLPPFMGNTELFLQNPDFQSAGFYGPTALMTFIIPQSANILRLCVYSCCTQQKIIDETITGTNEREIAHKTANRLYQYLTGGHEGYFTKEILHLLIRGKGPQKKNLLAVIHQDGQEGKILSISQGYKTIRTLKSGSNGWIGYVADNGRGKTQLRLRHLSTAQDYGVIMPGNVYGVTFSPCGNFLVACVAKNLGSDLWYYNLYTKEYRRLTFGSGEIINASPTINAQGVVVFTSSLQGKPKLYRINVNGTGLACISCRNGSYFSPSFSPKGDKISFVYQSGGSFYLGVMNLSDSSQEQMFLQGHMMDSPSWLNDITIITSYQGARYGNYSFLVADIYGLSKYTLAIRGKPSVDMPSVLH